MAEHVPQKIDMTFDQLGQMFRAERDAEIRQWIETRLAAIPDEGTWQAGRQWELSALLDWIGGTTDGE